MLRTATPSVPWDRPILREPDAGEFERDNLTDGTHAYYYIYDLLD